MLLRLKLNSGVYLVRCAGAHDLLNGHSWEIYGEKEEVERWNINPRLLIWCPSTGVRGPAPRVAGIQCVMDQVQAGGPTANIRYTQG